MFLDQWFIARSGGVDIHVLCMLSVIVVWIVLGQAFPLWTDQTAFASQTASSLWVAKDRIGIIMRNAWREDWPYAVADRGSLRGRWSKLVCAEVRVSLFVDQSRVPVRTSIR